MSTEIRATTRSERPPSEGPVDSQESVQDADSSRKCGHLRIESGGQETGQLAVSASTQTLCVRAVADKPARVAQQPPPAADLAAEPATADGQGEHRELSERQDGGEQDQQAHGVRGQHKHEAIALQQRDLGLVPAKVIVMEDVCSRIDHHAQAVQMRAPAQLDILLVHEQLAGEATEFAKDVATDRQRCPARSGNIRDLFDVLCRLTEATSPGETTYVHDGAA